MGAQRFSTGKRFHWQDAAYEIRQLLPEGKVSIENITTGAATSVDLPTLIQALFAGELWFVTESRQVKPEVDGAAGSGCRFAELADYPAHQVATARHRLEMIRPLLELEPGARTRAAVEARSREIQAARPEGVERGLDSAASPASIYRWLCDYTQSNGDLRTLIPASGRRGGKGNSRLCAEVEAIVEGTIQDKYWVREKVTVDDVLHEIAIRIEEENKSRAAHEKLVVPSRRTVARRIQALDVRDRYAAKRGERLARQEFSQYESTDYPSVPLERVEIDHTRMDLIVIDDRDSLPLGRLTLTYCLDMATRYPLGYYMGFEPPSYLAVMECLHHAICPKGSTRETYGAEHDWIAYGIPSVLMIDNAKEFVGQDLQDACLLLGIVLQQTPVKTPYFKAGIERLFGSLNTMLFHTLPGTTFSDAQQRGDYDSVEHACVYLSDVDRIMNLFIVDIYAQRFHRGLQGIPAQRWEAAMQAGFSPRVPPSAEELSVLLGRVTQRVIQHYGIAFQCLRYNSPELTQLRTRLKGEKVKIKYHPADLGRLHVYDPFEQRYIEVPALDQGYSQGLSLWKHRIICRAAAEENDAPDLAALGRAKRRIQEIVEAGRSRKRVATRSRVARWENGGKPSRQTAPKPEATDTAREALPAVTGEASKPLLSNEPTLNLKELEAEGWEVSYDLPRGAGQNSV